jgi:hypothetical protein
MEEDGRVSRHHRAYMRASVGQEVVPTLPARRKRNVFFNLGNTLRSLTLGPADAALKAARRQAHRYLAEGGPAAAERRRADEKAKAPDFVLPVDIDAKEVARAVRQKLGMAEPFDEGADPLHPLERLKLGGRIVLPGLHLLRLGDGRYDLGRRFMHGIISRIRASRRMRPMQRR